MKKTFFCLPILSVFHVMANTAPSYHMVTAAIEENEVVFSSDTDLQEAKTVGFFRIKKPENIDVEVAREFGRRFTTDPRYINFGVINIVNGYLQSEIAQTVRFCLDQDLWNHVYHDGLPFYPIEIQRMGYQFLDIGTKVLRCFLKQSTIPEELWLRATAGCSANEGSSFLLFNCYDPKLGDKEYGLAAHKDWSCVSVLDTNQPGLEAKIRGEWRELVVEEGYLIINFGGMLEELLPDLTASEHRVVTQKSDMRISIVAFLDPRLGPYREGVECEDKVGFVYKWDEEKRELVNGESTDTFYLRKSNALYGENQSGS